MIMFKKISVCVFIICFTLSLASSSEAQDSDLFKLLEKEQQTAAAGATTVIGVSPVVLRPTFNPGALEMFSFQVSNQSSKFVLINVSIAGAIYLDGSLVRKPLNELPENNLARWVKPLDNNIILPPKSTKQFRFKVHVPKDISGSNPIYITFAGSHVKDSVAANRDAKKLLAGVGYSAGVAAMVIADIAGHTTYKIDWQKNDVLVKDNSVKAVAQVKNVGTGALKLQLWGTILKSTDKKPLAILRRDKPGSFSPGQASVVESAWSNKPLPNGSYKLMLVISEKDRKLDDQHQEILFTIPPR